MIFYVPGDPKGKGRPRFGNGRTYTPESTVNYEQYVKYCFADAAEEQGFETIEADRPVRVYIRAEFEVPQRWSKVKKQHALDGLERPTKKPDCDNIIKIVLDALNGLAYKDDKQVVFLSISKAYAEEACVKVCVSEIVRGEKKPKKKLDTKANRCGECANYDCRRHICNIDLDATECPLKGDGQNG